MMGIKKKENRRIYGALILLVFSLFTGCGETSAETVEEAGEEILLNEPPAATVSYETVIRRDLLHYDVYDAVVCPGARQYGLEASITFDAYDVYPGQEVRKGQKLLHGNLDSVEREIQNLEAALKEAEENYLTFMSESNLRFSELTDIVEHYEEELEELEKNHQEESTYYKKIEKDLYKMRQEAAELEESMRQRKGLYELDHDYQLSQLDYLNKDQQKLILFSGMSGFVADIRILTGGDRVSGGKNLAAVADLKVKELKCPYISPDIISRAAAVYAVFDGKKYEVEYVPLETAEYMKLKKQNGTVYSTFTLAGNAEDVEIGRNGAIVVIRDEVRNALSVYTDSVKRDGSIYYVYLVKGQKHEYTPVRVGAEAGLYTEILSGLEEGDRIVSESDVTAEGEEYVLKKGKAGESVEMTGTLYYPFSDWVENPIVYGTVYLEEFCVSENQQVKAGDVLAKIRVEGNMPELEKNRLKQRRLTERLEELKETEEPDEKTLADKEAEIAGIGELILSMEKDYAATEIRAVSDGVITQIAQMKEGDRIATGEKLFLVADESRSCILLDDEGNELNYGQEAVVSYSGDDGSDVNLYGYVGSLGPAVTGTTLTDQMAFVILPDEEMRKISGSFVTNSGKWMRNTYTVTVQKKTMENVLLVPKKAVKVMDGYTYVKVRLESGEAVYRAFIAGGSDRMNYWAVEGLTEGMTICSE